MSSEVSSISPAHRAQVFKEAMERANIELQTLGIEVGFPSQWPPKPSEKPEDVAQVPVAFDERPDVDLRMKIGDEWRSIDIVYIRQMPIVPEHLKTIDDLARDILEKAKGHLEAMKTPETVYISSVGSKTDFSQVSPDEFRIDELEYIWIQGMRVVHKPGDFYKPIKACDLRSHTILHVVKEDPNLFVLTDDFDPIRTDGRKGFFCYLDKAIALANDQLVPARRANLELDEKEPEVNRFILLQRTKV